MSERNDASSSELDVRDDSPVPRDKEKQNNKSKPATGAKAKDLSHVPCKFFKVGSCTAGSSCPFSHSILEPGQAKDVCAWFVKGNCKFGHKCALAHILPGQNMSMDRKNKKAAQQAAAAATGGGNNAKDGGRGGRGGQGRREGAGGGGRSNSLLSGSTAPTRSSRAPIPPLNLKASISPSAPAPPLKDTEFASFGLPDESNQLPAAPAQRKVSISQEERPSNVNGDSETLTEVQKTETVVDLGQDMDLAIGLSPLSSPSNNAQATPTKASINGFASSPPTTGISPSHPQNHHQPLNPPTQPQSLTSNTFVGPSSPFSAPHSQSIFLPSSTSSHQDYDYARFRSGVAASLGVTKSAWGEFGLRRTKVEMETAVEDDDLEEFIPSSLTDLLTPEERSRRFSRTASTQQQTANLNQNLGSGALAHGLGPVAPNLPHRPISDITAGGGGHGHKHSHSVPGTSLLADLKSIWSENPNNPSTANGAYGGLGNGTPSSFTKTNTFGGRAMGGVDDLTAGVGGMSLSPTNASAAFLPSLHHHYMNAKNQAANTGPGLGRSAVGLSVGVGGVGVGGLPVNVGEPASLRQAAILNGGASLGGFGSRPPFEANNSDPYLNLNHHAMNAPLRPSGMGLTRHESSSGFEPESMGAGGGLNGGMGAGGMRSRQAQQQAAFSPATTRALQAHAPGQSLPQGLAAGYSRIHALPPLTSPVPSPSAMAFSPPQISSAWAPRATQTQEGQGFSGSPSVNAGLPQGAASASPSKAGGESMRLSYASAASQRLPTSNASNTPNADPPPGIGARTLSGKSTVGGTPLSPLSGPVVTGDDDELFNMDS